MSVKRDYYEVLGLSKGADAGSIKKAYRKLAQEIKKEFQTRYIDADGDLKQKSQTAYLLALKLDLFPTEEARKKGVETLVRKIAGNGNRLSTGFVGTAILNQTLSQFGESNTAYDLLLQRNNPSWLYSIDQGATTIWERWDSYTKEKGFGPVSMNSFNHYSYGAVSEWMYRTMGGIDIDETRPGFKHIVLQPVPDNRPEVAAGQERIDWVNASFPSCYGDIKSSWKKENDGSFLPSDNTCQHHRHSSLTIAYSRLCSRRKRKSCRESGRSFFGYFHEWKGSIRTTVRYISVCG